jgi:hypothetical protein
LFMAKKQAATMLLRVVWIFQVLLQMTEPLVFSPM